MTKNIAIAVLALALLIPATSNAARDYGVYRGGARNVFGEVSFTVKYGEITVSDDVPDDGSDIRNMGFTFGNGINDILSFEFEYTQTVSDGDDYDFASGGSGSADFDTLGFFLVGKSAGKLYVKGRVGYTRVAWDIEGSPLAFDDDLEGSRNVYGLAYGVGAGFKIGKNAAVELEYTVYPTRDNVEFDLGAPEPTVLDLEMDFVSVNFVWTVR
jgi:opacity protein-like surface antigen